MKRLVILAVAAMALSGCGAKDIVNAPDVEVDTPALQAAKAAAAIEPCVQPTTEKAAEKAKGLPDRTLPCFGGGTSVDLARLRGPMVVNLWAQWCGPCREELPYYQAFAVKYAGKVAVLGVNWRDNIPDRAMALLKETGVTYPQVADVGGSDFGLPKVLPGLLLIDADGKVAYAKSVVIKSEAELETLVKDHLGVTA